MKIIAIPWFLVVLIGCSKPPPKSKEVVPSLQKPKLLPFDSPIPFVYDSDLKGTEIIAIFLNEKLNESQLSGNDRALEDLLLKNQEQVIYLSYNWAISQKAKATADESITIQVPFLEPKKGLLSIFQDYKIQDTSSVEFKFSSKNIPKGSVQIGDQVYTYEQISSVSLPFAKNLERVFTLRMKRIEDQVSRRTLIKTADELKIPLNQYIKENIFEDQAIGDKEARQYAKENNIPEKSIDEDLMKRLKSIVKSRLSSEKLIAHSAKLLKDNPVRVAFNSPVLEVNTLTIPEGTPKKGTGSVKVTLISNFLCDKCLPVEQTINSLVDGNLNRIELSYLFHFKPENRRVRMVSEASLCVYEQNSEKFWNFQEASHQDDFDGQEKKIDAIVLALGLDYDAFRRCFLTRKFQSILDKQRDAVKTLGYLHLPLVIINKRVFENTVAIADLQLAINEEISKLKIPIDKAEVKTSSWWQRVKEIVRAFF